MTANHTPSIRLLIVSVGSLVGKNILDSIEYSEFPRRRFLQVFGTNSLAEISNNFRCDACFFVPQTHLPEFPIRMREVIRQCSPDLVLPARDADTLALWKLYESDPSLPGRLPFGNLNTVLFALNKWESYRFCVRHDLPFAETLLITPDLPSDAIARFIDRVGLPLVAKPVEGFASKGVFFVRSLAEAELFEKRDGYLLQEYLGAPNELEGYFQLLDGPKPLFAEAPNVSHHTCHIPIRRDGTLGEIFVLKNHHNFGAVTQLRRVLNPNIETIARRFANAFVSEGGCGPLSVQFREDRHGHYKAQEMNLRTTGSTFARLMMGQDEVGQLIAEFVPNVEFPQFRRQQPAFDLTVTKSLSSYEIWQGDVHSLQEQGIWRAKSHST